MRAWALMLGGLIVWAIHFLGVCLIVSLAALARQPDGLIWRIATAVFSLACLAGAFSILVLALVQRRRRSPTAFVSDLSAVGAGLAALAIAWQALAALIGG